MIIFSPERTRNVRSATELPDVGLIVHLRAAVGLSCKLPVPRNVAGGISAVVVVCACLKMQIGKLRVTPGGVRVRPRHFPIFAKIATPMILRPVAATGRPGEIDGFRLRLELPMGNREIATLRAALRA